MILPNAVKLEVPAGKQDSLCFYGERPELYRQIKNFLSYHNSYLDAKHHDVVKASGYFVQCDTSDYMMLEFWLPNYMGLVELLAQEFDLTVEDAR